MADTPNIVPRTDKHGGLGTAAKGWGKLFIHQAASQSTPAFTLENATGNQPAIHMPVLNTTADCLLVSSTALTTGNIIHALGASITTGSFLKYVGNVRDMADASHNNVIDLDIDVDAVHSNDVKGFRLNLDKDGITPTGKTSNIYGVHLDIDDTVTNVGTVNSYGVAINNNFANTGGTVTAYGLYTNVGGADTKYDIYMENPADPTEAAHMAVGAGGALTITTVSDDATGHLALTADGDIVQTAVAWDINASGAATIDATAMDMNVGSGTLELTTTGALDINSGAATIDTSTLAINAVGAASDISIVTAHTAGVAFHLDANADADSEVQIDAGILDIDVTAAATLDAVGVAIGAGSGELDLTTTGLMDINSAALDIDASGAITIDAAGAASHIALVTEHTAGQAFHLDANADAGSIVDIDAGILDIDVTAGTTIDTTSLTLTNITDDSSTQGGILRLVGDDGVLMQSGSRLGVIEFKGAEAGGGATTIGARIEAITEAAWSTTINDASLKFYTTDANAVESLVLTLDSNKLATFEGGVTIATTLTMDEYTSGTIGITKIQDSGTTFNDNDTSLLTAAAIEDHIQTLLTAEDLDVAADSGTAAVDLDSQSLTISGGTGVTTSASGQAVTVVTDASQTHVTEVGALNAGSITSGFTSIDVGAGAISTTGVVTGGSLVCTAAATFGGGTGGGGGGATITTAGVGTFDGAISSTAEAVTGLNYRTMYIDAGGMVPAVTNGAAAGTEELAANKPTVDYLAFDKDTDEYAQFKVVMPEQWNKGVVRARYYWKPSDGDTGTVVWALEGLTYAQDAAFMGTVFSNPAAADAQAATVDNDLIISLASGTAACTVQGTHAESNLVLFRITRDTSADAYTNDAHLLGVAIQYKEQAEASDGWS